MLVLEIASRFVCFFMLHLSNFAAYIGASSKLDLPVPDRSKFDEIAHRLLKNMSALCQTLPISRVL